MKTLIIFLNISAIILFCQCNSFKQYETKESKINIQVKIYNKLDTINLYGQKGTFLSICGLNGTFYSLGIEIANNSDSVFQFWTMNCSWQNNWISNNDSFSLFCPECNRNFPVEKQIKPGEKIFYKGIGRFKGSLNEFKSLDFKIGFIFIKKNEILNDKDFFKKLCIKKENKKDVIWSEPFKIDK